MKKKILQFPTGISLYTGEELNQSAPCGIMVDTDCTVDVTDWGNNTVTGVKLLAGIPYPFFFKKYENISDDANLFLLYDDLSTQIAIGQ